MKKLLISFIIALLLLAPGITVSGTSLITAEWTDITSEGPPRSNWGQLDYDSVNDFALFYGGTNGIISDATFIFDPQNQTWTELSPSVSPAPRVYHSMVFVESTQEFIMYGGYGSGAVWFDTTWSFNSSTMEWTELTTTGAPGGSSEGRLVYLPTTDTILLFRGYAPGFQESGDLWEYNISSSTWLKVDTINDPSPRSGASMSYNPQLDRLIFYGGGNDMVGIDETYFYNPNNQTWNEVNVTDTPASLASIGTGGKNMFYISDLNQTILEFGFYLFYFDIDAQNWVQIVEDKGSTEFRATPGQTAYLESTKQLLVYGGYKYDSPNEYYNDTYVATFSLDGVPLVPEVETTSTSETETTDTTILTSSSTTSTSQSSSPIASDTTESPVIGLFGVGLLVLFIPMIKRKFKI